MTRDEFMNIIYSELHSDGDNYRANRIIDAADEYAEEKVTAVDDILDKIRAEIEQITDTMGVSYNQYVSKIDVLQIIDKYKAESEEEK